jgi:hypothetical protein
MPLATRLAALQADQRHETQWHPRVWISVEKRAPYSSRNPMILTLTRQNPWWKTRTVLINEPMVCRMHARGRHPKPFPVSGVAGNGAIQG